MAQDKKKLTSKERALAAVASQQRTLPGQIEGRVPGFRYYAIDVSGTDEARLKSMKAKLEKEGWDLDPDAFVPASPGCEVWRIDVEAFQILEAARLEKRAERLSGMPGMKKIR